MGTDSNVIIAAEQVAAAEMLHKRKKVGISDGQLYETINSVMDSQNMLLFSIRYFCSPQKH